MTISRNVAAIMIAAALLSPAGTRLQLHAQEAGTAAAASPLPIDQLVTKTVHQAWVASGRNEDSFFAMVQQLAQISAQNRGITLPDTQGAGERFGAWIKQEARKDPDQLLYAVVDSAVRHIGKAQAAAANGAPSPGK